MSDFISSMVTDDPETNALWVVRFTSIQFGICFFTSLTRTDANAALALLGLYSSFGRRKEATKLYFIFLLLSLVTDFIWMIIYGNQISGAELQELQNEWEDYAFPPVGTAKFVLGMSIIQFIVKGISLPFTYKLFSNLGEEDSVATGAGYGGGYGVPRPPGSFVVGGSSTYQASVSASSYQAEGGGYQNAKDEL